jgi:hypothetical protein
MKRFGLVMSFAIAADRVHHIAFAAAASDECSIALFRAPTPAVAAPNADLVVYLYEARRMQMCIDRAGEFQRLNRVAGSPLGTNSARLVV